MKTTTFSVLCSFLIISLFVLSACKKDTTKGCTNPDAINYSTQADEDNGTCEFERDKFLGIWNGQKDCIFNPLDSTASIEIGPSTDNVARMIINDFPDVGLSATAIVNSSETSEFIIDVQQITNDLDIYSISGKGIVYQNTLVINYYKTYDSSSIDTCGLGLTKFE